MNDKKTFVTKEGLEKLKKELEILKEVRLKEIAERIQEAKELGDLSENAEYIDAKEQQGFVASKIVELEQKLKNSVVIKYSHTDHIQLGSTVTVKNGAGESFKYTIVGSSEADPLKFFISNESPMGKILIGKKAGEKAVVQTPKGPQEFFIVSLK